MALPRSRNQPLSGVPKKQTGTRAVTVSVRAELDKSGEVRRSLYTDLAQDKGGLQEGSKYTLGTARPSGYVPPKKSAEINGVVSDERW